MINFLKPRWKIRSLLNFVFYKLIYMLFADPLNLLYLLLNKLIVNILSSKLTQENINNLKLTIRLYSLSLIKNFINEIDHFFRQIHLELTIQSSINCWSNILGLFASILCLDHVGMTTTSVCSILEECFLLDWSSLDH